MRVKQVYKITYPNGKIYVGMDLTGDLLYLGSPSAAPQIAQDLGVARLPYKAHKAVVTRSGKGIEIRLPALNLVVRKDILWESDSATDAAVRALEMGLIREMGANDPAVGYNKVPKHVVHCRTCTHKASEHGPRKGCMKRVGGTVCGCTWTGP